MASFIENLWLSIFTPGPTPTLLRAANATFAALQLLLLILFVSTYSIHFVVLSLLCAALWYSINWFAVELKAAQDQEERAKQEAATNAGASTGDDTDDTEVEGALATGKQEKKGAKEQRALRERMTGGSASKEVELEETAEGQLKHRTGAASEAEEGDTGALGAGLSKGPSSLAGTQSSVSTEDEWEKVSENENEKDK